MHKTGRGICGYLLTIIIKKKEIKLKNKHKQEFHKRGKARGDNSPFS
jgi:hypothetical protein